MDVVSARTITTADSRIDVVVRIEIILQREAGQQLGVVILQLSSHRIRTVVESKCQWIPPHRDAEVIAGCRTGIVVHREAFVVDTQTYGQRKSVNQQVVEGRPMEESQVSHRRTEVGIDRHAFTRDVDTHGRSTVDVREDSVKHPFQHGDTVAMEEHGTVRTHILIGNKCTGHPLPAFAG